MHIVNTTNKTTLASILVLTLSLLLQSPSPSPLAAVPPNKAAVIKIPAPEKPPVQGASSEVKNKLASFQIPADFSVKLFAAESLIANPMTFTIEHQGRF
jgi:hypothetical protein